MFAGNLRAPPANYVTREWPEHSGISRIIRAAQLDFLKIHLPKEKWLTFEQDLAYRYLDAYLEEVIDERREIYEFGCVNYKSNHWPAFEVK